MKRTALALAVALCLSGLIVACETSSNGGRRPAGAPESSPPATPPVSPPTEAECVPDLRILAVAEGVQVRAGPDSAVFKPVLVGCREALDGLGEEEALAIVEDLRELVQQDIGAAGARRRDAAYQAELAEMVNASIGRPVVTRVLLADFFLWERRARRGDDG